MILSQLRPALLVTVCAFHLAVGTGHAAFSGDNGKLAFSSLVDGDKNVVAADPTPGSSWQRLTTHPTEDAQPAWSPDGSSVAFRARRPGHYY